MRKIDFKEYDSYTYKDAGFSYTSTNFDEVMCLLKERKKGVVYGNKRNGNVNILDGIMINYIASPRKLLKTQIKQK